MSAKDAALYGVKRQKRMHGEKEITTSNGSSFASQLGSLMSSSDPSKLKSHSARAPKEDIFRAHHRSAAASKKAQKHADAQQPFGQKHTVNGEELDHTIWQRSKRKMEDKARLYAAMKRGDVEDMDERYAVDFDKKWADKDQGIDEISSDDESEDEQNREVVDYVDEFGRSRTGTRAEIAREQRKQRGQADLEGDRFTARPSAPSGVIYGDTIQHEAFDPDAPVMQQMEALAKKRDRSLTPPPDLHFDAAQEVRQKGTGFFHFSSDAVERKRQMEDLEQERLLTEQKRIDRKREQKLRDEVLERDREYREDDRAAQLRRRADEFLNDLSSEIATKGGDSMDAMQRIEAALAKETEADNS